ncbi:MAG: hypothetical protein A2096_14430 [Spirochaetes bacterium GWF1_41_5]|nr:MAG: hypothetical protein A2096_14430 [Spirochaetes bacterium GWF1_41_5]HBE01801.1 hypothetical protein [Spirochaetia bacterium]
MKNCGYEEMLSAYIDHELNQQESDFIRQHLEVCSGCRKTLKGFTVISRALGGENITAVAKISRRFTLLYILPLLGAAALIVFMLKTPAGKIENFMEKAGNNNNEITYYLKGGYITDNSISAWLALKSINDADKNAQNEKLDIPVFKTLDYIGTSSIFPVAIF